MNNSKIIHTITDHLAYRRRQRKIARLLDKIGHIGKGCIVNPEAILVEKNLYMDDYSVIQNGVNFISHKGRLFLGKYSVLASGCTLIPEKHKLLVGTPFSSIALENIGDEVGDIVIKEDCWLGANSIIIGGRTIGRGAVVGAGSVVTKDIPPYAVVAGNPARIIAVKFSKDDIINHEVALYSPEERISRETIDQLFNEYYDGINLCRLSTSLE